MEHKDSDVLNKKAVLENVAPLNYNYWKTITLLHLQRNDQLINELQLIENDHSTAPTSTFNRVKMILRRQELEPE